MGEALSNLRLILATFAITSLGWVGVIAWGSNHFDNLVTVRRDSAPQPRTSSAAQTAPMATQQVPAGAPFAPTASAMAATLGGGKLMIPVAGVQPGQLVDTYSQARADGQRSHDAIDIPAPVGTPVLAAAAGTIEKLYLSKEGGNTIYLRSSDGTTIYYYAHLDGYAPGLSEKRAVSRGETIGRVGFSGNANPAAPHLHFAIWSVRPTDQWYSPHTALNPYPLLTRR